MIKKTVKTFFLILYYLIASKLPNYSFPGGKFYNWFRITCMKKIIKIGNNCRIMRDVYVGNGNNIEIGNHCRINEKVRLDNVKIGNHVMIARECIILGKMHEFSGINEPMEQQGSRDAAKTIIEDDVWFGLRVIVMPGIRIRKGTIVGAAAVVTKDTVEYGIYAGVPARLIKKRDEYVK